MPKTYLMVCDQTPWTTAAARDRLAAAGVAAEEFACVHGATVGIRPTLPLWDDRGRFATPGRVAIAASKLLLWQRIADRADDPVLVLEGDVTLCPDFRAELAKSMDSLPADWDVCHVGHCCTEDKPVDQVNDRVSVIRHPLCCHAVLWRRAAAAFAGAELRRHSWGTASDVILARAVYPRLRHYSLTPPLAFQDRAPSEALAAGRWDAIPGWFDFGRLYDEAIDRVAGPATFVEVGSWKGRSTAYMAEEIKRRLAPVAFYAVDTWKGMAFGGLDEEVRRDFGGDLFPTFERNMSRAGVWDYVRPLRMESTAAAATFADGSLDFVFIDADHEYPSVRADLAAWAPKLKPRGVLAGHDFDLPGVRRAVGEAFPGRYRTWERSWVVDPP